MPSEPFADKDVLYRFTPTGEERKFAQEYVYVRSEEENALYFQGRDGCWRTSLRLDRLIAHLLTERAALVAERDDLRGDFSRQQRYYESETATLKNEREDLWREIERLTLERDELKTKCERYEAALAQGAKIGGGT